MPASEAQIRANQANAQKSTGPKSEEGKQASRANSYKHGMTATTVMPEREVAEVSRRYTAFAGELKPSGEVGRSLVLLAARASVRMELCADRGNFMRLRDDANDRAMFGPSPEATLARKYEAAAERSFFRALKELRVVEKQAKVAEADIYEPESGSFLPRDMTDEEFDKLSDEVGSRTPRKQARRAESNAYAELKARLGLPISVGKRR